jgi:general secretion pathway protein G
MVKIMNGAGVIDIRKHPQGKRLGLVGFTLIELLVVLAIIAMLLSVALPRYLKSIDVANETTLAENLRATREILDKYYGDTGQYPDSLDQLVEKNYLRSLPVDPITHSAQTWIVVPPQAGVKGKVFNIHSGAAGSNRLGQPFADM